MMSKDDLIKSQAAQIENLKTALAAIRQKVCGGFHDLPLPAQSRHNRRVCKKCGLIFNDEAELVGDYYVTIPEAQDDSIRRAHNG